MPSSTPEDRRGRRALIRAHHPDLGGDAEAFIRVMAELGAGRPADELRFVRRPHGLARIVGWYRARRRRRRRNEPPRVL
jgi:hypothetical protein